MNFAYATPCSFGRKPALSQRAIRYCAVPVVAAIVLWICSPFTARAELPIYEATSEKDIIELVDKLAHQPELMNVRYLQCILGHPATVAQNYDPDKHYCWYGLVNGRRKSLYELVEHYVAPGQVSDAEFVAHLPPNKMDLKDVESRYGAAPWKLFDQRCYPVARYSFVPDTCLSFTERQDAFFVTEVAVSYRGSGAGSGPSTAGMGEGSRGVLNAATPGTTLSAGVPGATVLGAIPGTGALDATNRGVILGAGGPDITNSGEISSTAARGITNSGAISSAGMNSGVGSGSGVYARRGISVLGEPSADEMEAISAARRQKAMENHKKKNWAVSMPLLFAHLEDHPQDAEAHLALAQSYKSTSHLNEALCEYRTAMTLAQSGPIAEQALAGLRELRVIPPDDADMQGQPHEYELVHRGQGLRQGRTKQAPRKERNTALCAVPENLRKRHSDVDGQQIDPPGLSASNGLKDVDVGF